MQLLSQYYTGYSVATVLIALLYYSPVFRSLQLKLHYKNVFMAKKNNNNNNNVANKLIPKGIYILIREKSVQLSSWRVRRFG